MRPRVFPLLSDVEDCPRMKRDFHDKREKHPATPDTFRARRAILAMYMVKLHRFHSILVYIGNVK